MKEKYIKVDANLFKDMVFDVKVELPEVTTKERRSKILEVLDKVDSLLVKEMLAFSESLEGGYMTQEEHDAFHDLRMDVYETRKSLEY